MSEPRAVATGSFSIGHSTFHICQLKRDDESPSVNENWKMIRSLPLAVLTRKSGGETMNKEELLQRQGEEGGARLKFIIVVVRSEEHTSELQSLTNLVCRLLLEKKKKK